MTAGCLAGDQTGKQIDLVMGGNGDEQVGILHTGIAQNVIAGAAASYRSKVIHIGKLVQPAFGQIDQSQVVSCCAELAGQFRAYLAAAYNNDTHGVPPIYFSHVLQSPSAMEIHSDYSLLTSKKQYVPQEFAVF